MAHSRLLGNILWAFAAQGIAFLCSVLVTLIVPKLLGVENFGYWQLFIFYSSYVSVFQLGLNDGIYLRYGGQRRDAIDKSLIKTQYLVGLGFQSGIALVIVIIGVLSRYEAERSFVLYACAVYLVISNAAYFLGYLFQAMNETRRFSLSTILDRASFLIPLIACLLFRIDDFRIYVIFTIVSRGIALLYLQWNARDFLKSPTLYSRAVLTETRHNMQTGIILTFANVTGGLIIGVMRFCVDKIWGIETFGQLSLALSIVNFAMAFIHQVAMVLFPALRQVDARRLSTVFVELRDGLGLVMPLAYIAYYPLALLIRVWLPEYESSLDYLVLLMPVCVYETQTNVCMVTLIKVRNEPRQLLALNLLALVISTVGIAVAVMVLESVTAAVIFAVVGVGLRYCVSEIYLHRIYQARNIRLLISGILLAFSFGIGATEGTFLSSFIFTFVMLLLFIACNYREGASLLQSIRGRREH